MITALKLVSGGEVTVRSVAGGSFRLRLGVVCSSGDAATFSRRQHEQRQNGRRRPRRMHLRDNTITHSVTNYIIQRLDAQDVSNTL